MINDQFDQLTDPKYISWLPVQQKIKLPNVLSNIEEKRLLCMLFEFPSKNFRVKKSQISIVQLLHQTSFLISHLKNQQLKTPIIIS